MGDRAVPAAVPYAAEMFTARFSCALARGGGQGQSVTARVHGPIALDAKFGRCMSEPAERVRLRKAEPPTKPNCSIG